jgi:hypothetical protein
MSGKHFVGNNWYRSGPKLFQSQRNADRFIRENPENKILKVYVNPNDVSSSCLRTMEDVKILIGIAVSFFLLLFCIAKWNSL